MCVWAVYDLLSDIEIGYCHILLKDEHFSNPGLRTGAGVLISQPLLSGPWTNYLILKSAFVMSS